MTDWKRTRSANREAGRLVDRQLDRLVQIRILSRKTLGRIFRYKLKELVIGYLNGNKAKVFVGRRVYLNLYRRGWHQGNFYPDSWVGKPSSRNDAALRRAERADFRLAIR